MQLRADGRHGKARQRQQRNPGSHGAGTNHSDAVSPNDPLIFNARR
jgi:hypothetical protein